MPGSRHLHTGVQVLAGLALNVFPAIFIAIYARIAPIDTQGFLALALAIGVYVAQLFNAFIVEGRLATPDAHGELGLPLWVAVLAVVCATPLLFGPAVASSPVLMVASIGVMTGLLMSRSLGVVTGEWKREGFAALALIVASVVAPDSEWQRSDSHRDCCSLMPAEITFDVWEAGAIVDIEWNAYALDELRRFSLQRDTRT